MQKPQAIQTFQIQRPIRGTRVTLAILRRIYSDLSRVVEKKGDEFISGMKMPEGYTQEKFELDKAAVRLNAFKVTVTLASPTGANIYGESIDVFSADFIPTPLTSVFMTNNTAYASTFKSNPQDSFTLLLDFGKPPVFDWSSFVSNPTANNSNLSISGLDLTFVRSVESSIVNAIQDQRPFWKFIHAPFAYDIGLWFLAMPYGIYASTKIITSLVSRFPSFDDYKLALYIYAFVLFLSVYRFLFQYIKWIFPLNVYAENKDSSALHRSVIGAIVVGLIGKLIYDFFH
jgi:hypothetical protein